MKTKLLRRRLFALLLVPVLSLAGCSRPAPGNDGAEPVKDAAVEAAPEETQSVPVQVVKPPAPPAKEEKEPAQVPTADTDLTPSQGLEFESNGDGTCTLVGIGICKAADLVIPNESPEGDAVTLIDSSAFWGQEDIDSVTFLNGSYVVDDRAFQYSEITTVNIFGGSPVFGDSVFSACEDLNTINIQACYLETGDNTFYGCGKDATVFFSNCTGKLGKYAFQYSDLERLIAEDSELTFGKSCFSACEALTEITFRSSTVTAGENAFYGCGKQAGVTMTDCTVSLDDGAFQYSSLANMTITGPRVEIGKRVFSSAEDLAAVTIDSPSVELGENSFYGCEDLETVSICGNGGAENEIIIDDGVFQYCDSLTTVTVGEGSVKVGKNVFGGCSDDLEISVAGKLYSADMIKKGIK